MLLILYRILGAVCGAIIGTIFVFVLFTLIYYLMDLLDLGRARFRIPIFFLILPLIGAWFGFKSGPDFIELLNQREKGNPFLINGWMGRIMLVVPAIWLTGVCIFVFLFEPYGYRMQDSDYLHLVKVIAFPTVMFWICIFAAQYVAQGEQRTKE